MSFPVIRLTWLTRPLRFPPWKTAFLTLLAGAVTAPAHSAKLATTGTVNVPGPGELSYTVSAQKVPGTTEVAFWLDLVNEEAFDISIIACAMLRLKKPDISMPQYKGEKTGGKWVCTRDGNVDRPPGFHFGCNPVTVPKKVGATPGTAQAFDVVRDLGRAFKQSDIAAVYWDVLEDCPLDPSCGVFDVADVNLTPAFTDIITNTANIWGGNWFNAECLSEELVPDQGDHCTSVAFWDIGNWVTMGFPDTYPARIEGEISGSPSGTMLTLVLTDQVSITYVATGVPIAVSTAFVIPEDPNAVATLTVNSPVPVGTKIRLEADVVADINNPVYSDGQFMYGVAINIFQEASPPTVAVDVERTTEGALVFLVSSTDPDTMPSAASVAFSVNSGPEQILALDFGDPAVDSAGVVQFEGVTAPLMVGSTVDYEVFVADTVGNIGSMTGSAVPTLGCDTGEKGVYCSKSDTGSSDVCDPGDAWQASFLAVNQTGTLDGYDLYRFDSLDESDRPIIKGAGITCQVADVPQGTPGVTLITICERDDGLAVVAPAVGAVDFYLVTHSRSTGGGVVPAGRGRPSGGGGFEARFMNPPCQQPNR